MKTLCFVLTLLIAFAVSACGEKACIEVPDPTCICTEIYDPVCGCNGTTYSNPCTAECSNITDYKPGACGS